MIQFIIVSVKAVLIFQELNQQSICYSSGLNCQMFFFFVVVSLA